MHKQKLKENGLGYIDPKQNRVITTHGFRSTFRDWSADKTDYPKEVCEHVLAHKLPDERADNATFFLFVISSLILQSFLSISLNLLRWQL